MCVCVCVKVCVNVCVYVCVCTRCLGMVKTDITHTFNTGTPH
jgi:hypothetical protein